MYIMFRILKDLIFWVSAAWWKIEFSLILIYKLIKITLKISFNSNLAVANKPTQF